MGELTIDAIMRAAAKLPPANRVPTRVEMAASTFRAGDFARASTLHTDALSRLLLPIRADDDLPHGVMETVYADGHRERRDLTRRSG